MLPEAWASQKSFRPRVTRPPTRTGGNPTVDFHGHQCLNATFVVEYQTNWSMKGHSLHPWSMGKYKPRADRTGIQGLDHACVALQLRTIPCLLGFQEPIQVATSMGSRLVVNDPPRAAVHKSTIQNKAPHPSFDNGGERVLPFVVFVLRKNPDAAVVADRVLQS